MWGQHCIHKDFRDVEVPTLWPILPLVHYMLRKFHAYSKLINVICSYFCAVICVSIYTYIYFWDPNAYFLLDDKMSNLNIINYFSILNKITIRYLKEFTFQIQNSLGKDNQV